MNPDKLKDLVRDYSVAVRANKFTTAGAIMLCTAGTAALWGPELPRTGEMIEHTVAVTGGLATYMTLFGATTLKSYRAMCQDLQEGKNARDSQARHTAFYCSAVGAMAALREARRENEATPRLEKRCRVDQALKSEDAILTLIGGPAIVWLLHQLAQRL